MKNNTKKPTKRFYSAKVYVHTPKGFPHVFLRVKVPSIKTVENYPDVLKFLGENATTVEPEWAKSLVEKQPKPTNSVV